MTGGPRRLAAPPTRPGRGGGATGATVDPRLAERLEGRRRRGRHRLVLGGLLLALVVALLWLVLVSPYLRVTQVDTVVAKNPAAVRAGVRAPGESSVRAQAGVGTGAPIVRVDTAAAEERLTATGLYDEVDVRRRLPGTVVVDVVPATPVAVWRHGGEREAVSASGAPLGAARSTRGLVPVTLSSPATAQPDAVRQRLAVAAAVLGQLPAAVRKDVDTVTVVGLDHVRLRLGDLTVEWGDDSEADLKVRALEALRRTDGATVPGAVVDLSAPRSPVVLPSSLPSPATSTGTVGGAESSVPAASSTPAASTTP